MRHVTNWQARSTDKLLPYYFLSPSLTFFMVSPVALLAVRCLRKISVANIQTVTHTNHACTEPYPLRCMHACTLRHNHKRIAYLAVSMYVFVHVINDTD